jgi:pectate lyase
MTISPTRWIQATVAGSLLLLAFGSAHAAVEGYATLNGGTTGGAGGQVVYASTGTEINQAMCSRAADDTPLIIYVTGTINHGNTTKVSGSCDTTAEEIQFKGVKNISLIGVGNAAVFDQIGIHLRDTSNIILQNLHIKNVKKSGSPTSNGGDAIGMESNVFNVWVDHCELEASGGESDGYDSLLDMKATTQYVTVSYTYYHDSDRGGLMGSSDSDNTNTFVTFHHNYYKNMNSRLPLLRHGTAHAYNNYYDGIRSTGMNPRIGGKIKAQNNYFENARNPIGTFYTTDMGTWDVSGNIFGANVTWVTAADEFPAGPNVVSTTSISIPYSYKLDSADCVPQIIKTTAGFGKGLLTSDGTCSVNTSSSISSSSSVVSSRSSSIASSSRSSSSTSVASSKSSSVNSSVSVPTGTNLSVGAGADGTSKGAGSYGNVLDGNLSTYWSPVGSTGRVSVKWSTAQTVSSVVIREAAGFEGVIGSWTLVNNANGAVLASGTGASTINFSSVSTTKLNFNILSASGTPAVAEFETYSGSVVVSSSSLSSSVSSSSRSSSISSSIQSLSSSSRSSSLSSSSTSSSIGNCATQCNWWGTTYPSCVNQAEGWGWENGKSCIGNTTCASQPQPYGGGLINSCGMSSSSSISSSRSSSLSSSISSSRSSSSLSSSRSSSSLSSSSSRSSSNSSSSSSSSISSSRSSSSSSLSSSSRSSASSSSVANTTACQQLINDSSVNWRESSLQTDQEIVACLYNSLGKAVGFGEKATGGYNPAGGSNLIVIKKNTGVSLEQQILDAISTDAYNWIVFDKDDFATETDIAMYRLNCGDAAVLSALDGATQAQCLSHTTWCAAKGVSSASCASTFFNSKLNNASLAIRNKMIMDNTTIDGRGSKAYFYFNGLKIGADDSGASTQVSQNVIITNMEFRGAGHVEDHGLDPDMIRSTGASHDIWIHQNTFDTTGDSAFDVKVGAYDITVSFNLVKNVKRAALHGSSDSHTIDTQIKTTIHNNAFVTTDADYSILGNTMRRVPLLRHGQSHMFNNVFYGYRKDLMSVRVGGRLLFENNMIVNNISNSEGDDISYWAGNLVDSAYEDGGLKITGSYVWAGDGNCQLQGTGSDLSASYGSTPDMNALYSSTSQATINANRFTAGNDLADYVFATAGKGGKVPYNSTYTAGRAATIAARPVSCQ